MAAHSHSLSNLQVHRYGRQMLVPQLGAAGQERLTRAAVLVVGAGGLGSPALLYLAAAGVGRLGVVDHDEVDLSNLHRQVLHREAAVGTSKAESAAAACMALNSSITVVPYRQRITQEFDVVLDCTDNLATRYLLNDVCVVLRRPLVSAAAVSAEGQLSVYNSAEDGPCYRCVFPQAQRPENCQRCVDSGVLGPVPGVMGTMQALEAMKVLAGVGRPLTGKLLLYDALFGSFHTIKLCTKDPACAVCGEHPTITRQTLATYDYTAFAGTAAYDAGSEALEMLPARARLSVRDLRLVLDGCADESVAAPPAPLLLDVRPSHQHAIAALPGSLNVPYEELDARMAEVLAAGRGREVYVICRRGNDSQLAVRALEAAGLVGARDVQGGLEAWRTQVDPTWPQY